MTGLADRPDRLDFRRPYLFTFLIVITIMVVTSTSAAGAPVFGLPARDVELGAELVLAVLAAAALTRLHSWRGVGFRPLASARDLRLYWVPLFPALPVLATAVTGLAGIGFEQLGFYLVLAGLIGFVEEVFFRGLILRSLATRGMVRAAIVSSLLFGLMHWVNVLFGADPAATLIQVGYATAMGFTFAAVTLRTGVIWPLIVIHGLINAAGFVTADETISTSVTSANVMVSVLYIVGFTIYGIIVLQTTQRPAARTHADEGTLTRSSNQGDHITHVVPFRKQQPARSAASQVLSSCARRMEATKVPSELVCSRIGLGPDREGQTMTIRIPAESRPGASEGIDDAVWRPAPVGAQTQAFLRPWFRTRDRPLPVFYLPLLGLLVCVAASYGLLVDDAYRLVSDLTRQTWRAQDAVTVVTVPVLLYATWRARRGSLVAHLVSVGILIWLTYGYAHLAIGTPFNAMFLVYLSVLTLAGFAMLDGLLRVDVAAAWPAFARVPCRATAWFLGIAGVGIGALWLSEIVVALPGGLPTNIHLAELPNPTWVLDLGWIIPSSLVAAVMLRRRHPAGPVVAGTMLVMLLILSATMLAAVPFALAAGLGADPVVRLQLVIFTIVFTTLGGIETWLLACAHRRFGVVRASWLRPGWWPEGS